ncbi:tRNA uridine-5-carboxymethylaminomethyl(34) synthesis GTPase MnmE [Litoreibacter arenae]|uniref:tRNA modification GTPase MnmE n=1 Tax=Litoreibacter arenae DSM 19593 TaxID=1123360 RepID=S9RHR9_9RHOB|nr:tRNA uridine-5-carboxymethylaminomethyl(34) synthesis GTPase MnmE [Litoreibacter arenae]EPX77620.1 GTPase and tRNA-U34 5-formylation enzyme TrmE [Litoreibacter arenae DSM 19593]
MDTIFALATARGKAGVSIIRLSGPKSFDAAKTLTGRTIPPREPVLASIRDHDGSLIDKALVLGFAGGASFTGEDVVELHLHGSPSIVAAVLRVLGDAEDLRLAEPGEFTRRAMENGKLDLAQVEGLADLIDAETEAQRRQAIRVFSGALGAKTEGWRRDLVRAAALLEATIDFADEDLPVDVSPEVRSLTSGVRAELDQMAAGVGVAERIRDGFEVAIVGPPNIGKSTLLNTLAGREAAITSSVAGTTRDIIEVRMDLRGLPVSFLDTAGLRDTADEVETIGIARAVERAASADMRVFLLEDAETRLPVQIQADDVVLQGKADQTGEGVSGLTGQGVPELLDRVHTVLSQRVAGAGLAIRERHRVALVRASAALAICEDEMSHGMDRAEIAAEELRSAVRALETMIGRVDVESVLDEIFASFCLGK